METTYHKSVREIAINDLRQNYSLEKINGYAVEHFKYLEKLLNSNDTTKLNRVLGLNKINYNNKNMNRYKFNQNGKETDRS